ncbi:MAG: hypothetical protein WD845_12145 [Pirellulales bacterium]
MAPDLLERLAQTEVPPPPDTFDRQLHDKVNRTLLITQFVDLFLVGMPWAFLQFSRALLGFVAFTVTGRYEPKSKKQSR